MDWPEEVKKMQREWIGRREEETVTYNLRDWVFSRQRYWGEPIPVIHGPNGEVEPETRLPLVLPESPVRRPAVSHGGEPLPALAHAREWAATVLPGAGESARRETNVMPQWAGSSWYYLRFIDPHNDDRPWDRDLERAWMPVDLYVGGVEQATLHLIYARFWHKVFYDLGLVSTKEPFQRLFNQGLVHNRSYKDGQGRYYYPEEVYEKDGAWFAKAGDAPLESRIEKMSKGRYNVVRPEPLVEEFGADALRVYELFMGPLEASGVWQDDGIRGARRFLDRVWHVFEMSAGRDSAGDDEETDRLLHRTIEKVTADIESLKLNTAVSQLMIFTNHAIARGGVSRDAMSVLVRLLAPFAPHICEEMWEALGETGLVLDAPWPEPDRAKSAEETVTVVVQVNGRVRARIECPRGAGEEWVRSAALDDPAVRQWVDGKRFAKTVYVPEKVLNLVVQ